MGLKSSPTHLHVPTPQSLEMAIKGGDEQDKHAWQRND